MLPIIALALALTTPGQICVGGSCGQPAGFGFGAYAGFGYSASPSPVYATAPTVVYSYPATLGNWSGPELAPVYVQAAPIGSYRAVQRVRIGGGGFRSVTRFRTFRGGGVCVGGVCY